MATALSTRVLTPAVIAVDCIDDEAHTEDCTFATHNGVLPCNCDEDKRTGSWWWQCWLAWNTIRVQHGSEQHYRPVAGREVGPGRLELPWPIKGADDSPWIPGRDFNDAPYEG